MALVATRAQLRRQEQDEKLRFDRLRRENAQPTTLDKLNAEDDAYEPPADDVPPADDFPPMMTFPLMMNPLTLMLNDFPMLTNALMMNTFPLMMFSPLTTPSSKEAVSAPDLPTENDERTPVLRLDTVMSSMFPLLNFKRCNEPTPRLDHSFGLHP